MKNVFSILVVIAMLTSCGNHSDNPVDLPNATIDSFAIGGVSATVNKTISGVSGAATTLELHFSKPIDVAKVDATRFGLLPATAEKLQFSAAADDDHTLVIGLGGATKYLTNYRLTVFAGANCGVDVIDDYTLCFMTEYDPSDKFQQIGDEELLTKVQQQTFKYFYDYAHPNSGMARERLGSGNTTTTGGTGFGIAAIPVAVERDFITRQEGYAHLRKIVDFLTTADRFHGAWSHWVNGATGKAIAFGTKDNGGDLVETAFLIEGLLVAKAYFENGSAEEQLLCNDIQTLYEGVEWDWYTREGSGKLYWHWSPEYQWEMNMPISGWNECLITYILAASSPTHPIDKSTYDNGWAKGGAIGNGNIYYNTVLPLGSAKGGPMFFAHYSFLGLDPRNLSDAYADYWQQNRAHAVINRAYCVENPKGWYGYGERCWGLTASDISDGYTASSPTNDRGTIAPTAALASMPYTPDESLTALRFFYYQLGDRLWGDYGFKDAFCLSKPWFASSYLAIDQGPIIVMIENHRTALCWKLFMSNSDIRSGLTKLGFTY